MSEVTLVNVPSRLLRYSSPGPSKMFEGQVGIIVVFQAMLFFFFFFFFFFFHVLGQFRVVRICSLSREAFPLVAFPAPTRGNREKWNKSFAKRDETLRSAGHK